MHVEKNGDLKREINVRLNQVWAQFKQRTENMLKFYFYAQYTNM